MGEKAWVYMYFLGISITYANGLMHSLGEVGSRLSKQIGIKHYDGHTIVVPRNV